MRHTIVPKLGFESKKLITLNRRAQAFNDEIELLFSLLDKRLLDSEQALLRNRFVTLPFVVCTAYMHRTLSKSGVKDITTEVVVRAALAAKTLLPGKKIDLGGNHWLVSGKTKVKVLPK